MKLKLHVQAKPWTRRAAVIIETGIVLFWLGILLRNEKVTMASAVIFSYVILALAVSLALDSRVTVQRRLSSYRSLEDEAIAIDLSLKNWSRRPVLVQLKEIYPGRSQIVEGGSDCLVIANPESSTEVNIVIRLDFRGHYVIPEPDVKLIDELGLRERSIKAGAVSYLSVVPPIEDLSDLPPDSKISHPEIGTFRSGSVGVGTEFFGIRDYLPGDELGRINWKASARSESLLSNEYEREHVTNIYLFVDLTAIQIETLRWTVRVASSIATHLLRGRNRLGLIVVAESTSHVKIESGRRQLLRVLDKLVTAEPGGTGELSTYLIRVLEGIPNCEVMIVSALASESMVQTVLAIKRKRGKVFVITRRDVSREAGEQDLVLKAATLMHVLRRRATIQRLRNADVRVIEIVSGNPIRPALSQIRERPFRR